ncbi:MAG: hypothetical protein ACJ746_15305 [Bryobacteraceae bacterium]
MPKQRGAYSKTKSLKAMARERIGTPPPARLIPDKAHRPKPKHKKLVLGDE